MLDERDFSSLSEELELGYKGVAAVYYRTVQKIQQELRGGGGRRMLTKAAVVNRVFDEDLYQELRMTMLRCIRVFLI